MKKYYIYQYNDFENTYNLYYIDDNMDFDVPDEWVQITRKEALRLCAAEKARRKENPSFAYLADLAVFPADYTACNLIGNDPNYTLRGNIWERT